MRRITVIASLLLFSISVFSQSAQPSISFKETEHVFGKINNRMAMSDMISVLLIQAGLRF